MYVGRVAFEWYCLISNRDAQLVKTGQGRFKVGSHRTSLFIIFIHSLTHTAESEISNASSFNVSNNNLYLSKYIIIQCLS